MDFQRSDDFIPRHIGPREEETREMLQTLGAESLEALIDQTIPAHIRLKKALELPPPMSESEYARHIRELASKNKVFRSYIGLGYYNTITPAVIQRNIFENPGWYTSYTPYQAEISQGRMEALFNFQTLVSELTALPMANASLLDEGTAAAEAMHMFFAKLNRKPKEAKRPKFFVSDRVLPQTLAVLEARAHATHIRLVVGDQRSFTPDESYFGLLLQYPAEDGRIEDDRELIARAKEAGLYVVMAADILSLALLTPPGELGADAAVGNTQRMGVPMGYGGPHAGYFSCTEEFKRLLPGRIIGLSKDAHGNPAYRMALQTREQHIRREKATSNICTAQALLAIMAGMYAVYHGPEGLKRMASRIHALAGQLAEKLEALGFEEKNRQFFDTLRIDGKGLTEKIKALALEREINFRYFDNGDIGISLDETFGTKDLNDVLEIFAAAAGSAAPKADSPDSAKSRIPESLRRKSPFLEHRVFNSLHSETEMMRYIKRLENRDISLMQSMIPLGSCTMKLNAVSELMPLSRPEFNALHPFVPADQAEGYGELLKQMEKMLSEITGLSACSLQPNSGAQGELTGMLVIRAYHDDHGDAQRTVALIPASAHGTNPASAVMAGLDVVVVKCDEKGNIDVDDLKEKAEKYKDSLAALMVTYPSTHGVFEEAITEICEIVHRNGGLVYMDGANMNAQVGYTSPAMIGADVCHLNLHKTFAIPHGGGGPGMGPICVNEKLKPYLPGHPLVKTGGEKAIPAVCSTPYGSASIIVISYGYIRMLGAEGLKMSTAHAILNANYLKNLLEKKYPILYTGKKGRVAHEFILDTRHFKHSIGIDVEDIAKRLIDYGYHAPTVSFPVAGTLMIEPTESESKSELDKFAEAMYAIREEIRAVEEGRSDAADNVLKNAPHTASGLLEENWEKGYSRKEAAYPADYLYTYKYWPPVGRIDNAYGDRNLICTCPPMDEYEHEPSAVFEVKLLN